MDKTDELFGIDFQKFEDFEDFEIRRIHRRVPYPKRKKIVQLYLQGDNLTYISGLLDIPRSTVHRIILIYIQEKRIKILPSGGRTYCKLTPDQKQCIVEYYRHNFHITSRRMCEILEAGYGISFFYINLPLIFPDFLYAFTRIDKPPTKCIPLIIPNSEKHFAKYFMKNLELSNIDNFVFFDDVPLKLKLRIRSSPDSSETPSNRHRSGSRSKSFNISIAVSNSRILKHHIRETPKIENPQEYQQGYEDHIKDFILATIDTFSKSGLQKPIFFLNINKLVFYLEIQKYLDQIGAKMVYYPSDLEIDPIDLCISKWQKVVASRKAGDFESLRAAMDDSFEEVNPFCQSYFNQVQKHYKRIDEAFNHHS
ncbi:hypothetical protein AYI68_g6336 [Smittium mucronatum]|uniref:Tc1-like transposase DDE domain-containing protein n=1 Tax=Smittium mucronatum TaxID=133383 RepID=A0A1R0GRR3_9FUNG|nr:hypothetical protein AYI68_g6336 [Smittium mucronatum]